MALTPQQRQQVIDTLVSNCDCWKHDGDREILNSLSDDKLEHLHEDSETHVANTSIVELVTNGFTDDETGVAYRIDPESGNVQRARVSEPTGNKEVCYDDEEEEEIPPPRKAKKPTMNRQMSEEEFWKAAPPSLKKQHAKLIANERKRKSDIIDILTSNIEDDEARERQVGVYNKLEIEDLEELAAHRSPGTPTSDEYEVPSYAGMGISASPRFTVNQLDQDFELPTDDAHYNTGITRNGVSDVQPRRNNRRRDDDDNNFDE